ncbi:MAG: MFS transporter [Treponema sp.]|jgi:predicted MFS family arabinose efflux permease|nr:MFS transporter [Treponema sp.]
MKEGFRRKVLYIGLGVNVVLTIFLLANREQITLRPWETAGTLDLPTYTAGNDNRTAIITDSEKSVVVLNAQKELLYQIRADPGKQNRFSVAKFAALDQENNLYVLDARFGGVRGDNIERVLRYSEKGVYLGEMYRLQYINEDFILTKGKIAGMACYGGLIYLLRLERDGFWLEQRAADGKGKADEVFFNYPNAFRDLVYGHISAENRRITITSKAGTIKQFDFNGGLAYTWNAAPSEKALPWTAVSDSGNNLMYADIMAGVVFSLDARDGARKEIYAAWEDQSPYYRINYAYGKLFATSNDNIFIGGADGYEIIGSYRYAPFVVKLRIALFAGGILDVLVFLAVLAVLVIAARPLLKKKLNGSLKIILITGTSIAFGGIIASFLILNEMGRQYNNKMFREIENISRVVSTAIDTETLLSLTSPADYDTNEYLRFKESLTALFSKTQFTGERIYQLILMKHDTNLVIMYDLESSIGLFYPFDKYVEGHYKEAYESGEYVHTFGEETSEGSWLFVCGPIFDKEGNIIALIETGYDMLAVQEQTHSIIIQTLLIVAAASVAFFLAIIEFILVFAAWKKNKTEIEKGEAENPPFYPELLRAIVFFLFIVNNLEAAVLPTYAAQLYVSFLRLPKEFIVTLPIIADMGSAAMALLVIPILLEKAGLKPICLASVIFICIGNILCFAAPDTLYLAAAHVFTGFAGGSLLLVINTIIGSQQNIRDVNNGFAHFNASYLAGMNAGVVLGSILAQFFPYRIVYLFSSFLALALIGIAVFSVRSKHLKHIYNIGIQRKKEGGSLASFMVKPAVSAALVFLIIPYVASLSFTSYFMPIYGIENGLRESNIGQLILLNGLFAILFGASLCEFIARKIAIKLIIVLSLALNAGAIYLFSLNMSVSILVVVIFILAIVNIFALTNIQTYYATLYQNAGISSSKALGVYSAVENASMAAGPVVFSYIVSENIALRMRILAGVLLGGLFLFTLFSGICGGKATSNRSSIR